MPEKQKPGPKPTGRKRIVRYWTRDEEIVADALIRYLRRTAGIPESRFTMDLSLTLSQQLVVISPDPDSNDP